MHQKFKAIEELAEFIVALQIVIYGKWSGEIDEEYSFN